MFGGNSSGIEMMLKSMGLGTVIDAAKELAESGAVQRIMAFSDGLEELSATIRRIEQALASASNGNGDHAGAGAPLRLAALECRECNGLGGAELRGGPGACERCGRSAEPAALASAGGAP